MGCGSSKSEPSPQPRHTSQPSHPAPLTTRPQPPKTRVVRVTAQRLPTPSPPQPSKKSSKTSLGSETSAAQPVAKPLSTQKPFKSGPPVGYVVGRDQHNPNIVGVHVRRRSSLERHLAKAPILDAAARDYAKGRFPSRYPKKYHNGDVNAQGQNLFLNHPGTLYEFPSSDFPYAKQHHKSGKITGTTWLQTTEIRGHTRTITDKDKKIQGVVYHPLHPDAYNTKFGSNGFRRAEEI